MSDNHKAIREALAAVKAGSPQHVSISFEKISALLADLDATKAKLEVARKRLRKIEKYGDPGGYVARAALKEIE